MTTKPYLGTLLFLGILSLVLLHKLLLSSSPTMFLSFRTREDELLTCLNIWDKKETNFQTRKASYAKHNSSYHEKLQFDLFEPSWDCEEKFRVGQVTVGDGPKWSCFPQFFLRRDSCLIYSIGSDLSSDYEEGIMEFSANVCDIHTYDCTVTDRQHYHEWVQSKKEYLTFHPECLGVPEPGTAMKTLKQLMEASNHTGRHIDFFKIDCEGCEYSSFYSALTEFTAQNLPIGQLQIEIHLRSGHHPKALFALLDKLDLRLFSKERNHWGCDGYGCVEFSLISGKSAFEAHIYHYCPQFSDKWEQLCRFAEVPGCLA